MIELKNMESTKLENALKQLKPKSTVCLDGYSGIGKTTLLKNLAKKYDFILPVYMDDFILTGKERKKKIQKAKDPSSVFELEWYDYNKIKELTKKFRKQESVTVSFQTYNPSTDQNDKPQSFNLTKKVLVIEGVFLLHPKLFPDIFDYKVFIVSDMKKADRQRVKREKKRWGKSYVPEDDPKSYTRLFKIAYKRYLDTYHPEKSADLIIKIS